MKFSRRKYNQENSRLLEANVIDNWLQEHGDPAIERLVKKNLAISTKISQILVEKNMRPADLARLMNKQKSEISKWLSGQHTFTTKTIASIEDALASDIIFIEPVKQNVYWIAYVKAPADEVVQEEVFFEESAFIGEYESA